MDKRNFHDSYVHRRLMDCRQRPMERSTQQHLVLDQLLVQVQRRRRLRPSIQLRSKENEDDENLNCNSNDKQLTVLNILRDFC